MPSFDCTATVAVVIAAIADTVAVRSIVAIAMSTIVAFVIVSIVFIADTITAAFTTLRIIVVPLSFLDSFGMRY